VLTVARDPEGEDERAAAAPDSKIEVVKVPVQRKKATPPATKIEWADVPPESQSTSGMSALTYSLGGVGLIGLGGFGLLTEWGRRDNRMLAQCSPSCPQATVDHIRRLYIAADISLGVGIAAIGAACWVYVSSRSTKEERSSRESVVFDLQPTKSGALLALSGSFR
jgi:hypothetical protein